MVTGNAVEFSDVTGLSNQLLVQLGQIGLWLQAIGVIAILWIIFQFIGFLINRKYLKQIVALRQDMARLEKKFDSMLNRSKKSRR